MPKDIKEIARHEENSPAPPEGKYIVQQYNDRKEDQVPDGIKQHILPVCYKFSLIYRGSATKVLFFH
jgi:hypothetical protein